MASETRSAEYEILDRSVAVEWIATDFSNQVAGLLEDARIPLLDAGVIFSRPDPNEQGVIYVTDKMPDDMQGFSALHEQLCQNENVAPCSQVESSVLDIMTATDRVRYLSLCLPMFVAVCKLYPDNKSLAATRDMLGRLHQK